MVYIDLMVLLLWYLVKRGRFFDFVILGFVGWWVFGFTGLVVCCVSVCLLLGLPFVICWVLCFVCWFFSFLEWVVLDVGGFVVLCSGGNAI